MACFVQHTCTVNASEGTLTVTFPDHSSVVFALELAYRSHTLRTLLEDARDEAQFTFMAPHGLLRSWLRCARAIVARADTLETLDGPELVKALKVSFVC